MLNSSSNREVDIKRKIINIVKSFRSLGLLSDSDVRITDLSKSNTTYDVAGEYRYKPAFSQESGEVGTFNISLNDLTLDPMKVKITPKS